MKYEEAKDLYNKLVDKQPGIERKGKTMPYTSINGHMTSFLNKEGKMGLRLSKDDIAEFIEQHEANVMEQHGRVMKEFVEVPEGLLGQTDELAKYFERSVVYVGGLKPKATKKK